MWFLIDLLSGGVSKSEMSDWCSKVQAARRAVLGLLWSVLTEEEAAKINLRELMHKTLGTWHSMQIIFSCHWQQLIYSCHFGASPSWLQHTRIIQWNMNFGQLYTKCPQCPKCIFCWVMLYKSALQYSFCYLLLVVLFISRVYISWLRNDCVLHTNHWTHITVMEQSFCFNGNKSLEYHDMHLHQRGHFHYHTCLYPLVH